MKIIFALINLLSVFAIASTINAANGDLYQGQELVNEQATGKICYLYVDFIESNPIGKYCAKLTTRPVFSTDRSLHPQDSIVVQSRITNYHRSEYPNFKTCAASLDGKTSGFDIYGDDDSLVYTPFFSWEGSMGRDRFDFFVTFSPSTKQPTRIRLHRLNWMTETNYDCINLKKFN